MKGQSLITATIVGLLLMPASAVTAQPGTGMPNRGPRADKIVERQVERQLERAQREAERLQQQAERVRQQTADRAEQQAERVREQAADKAQQQVERAQKQAERAQQQMAERARQQAERVQQQAERVQQQAERVQQQAERVQQQAERVQQQAERAQQQAERTQQKAAERAQKQAERVQQQAEKIQQQAEHVQHRAEKVQQQAAGRVRQQVGRAGRLVPAAAAQARDPAPSSAVAQANRQPDSRLPASGNPVQASEPAQPVEPGESAQPGETPVPAAPIENAPSLPERLAVADQSGEPAFVEITIEPNVRVLEQEWLMMLTGPQRDELALASPQLMEYHVETRPFEALDSFLLKFRVPPGLDSAELLAQLVPETLRNQMDRNHVYSVQTDSRPTETLAADSLTLPMAQVCTEHVSIGMIDTAVDDAHNAFNRTGQPATLISRHFLEDKIDRPTGHGTAVAAILVGYGPDLKPLLPNATVYSASVMYSQDPHHQGATALNLLEALDWLIAQDVSVINMSLTGPANRLLEMGINAATERGKVVVAAAGNAGPHAAALYPAAYENVVTATAVSRDRTIYRWANQGEHVDFAALGVDVPTAKADGESGFGVESGTSMAAPVVSAFVACALAGPLDPEQAIAALRDIAVDLGEPGHDPVFGHGLLHPQAFQAP